MNEWKLNAEKKNNDNHNNLKFQGKFDEMTNGCWIKNVLALSCESIKLKKLLYFAKMHWLHL